MTRDEAEGKQAGAMPAAGFSCHGDTNPGKLRDNNEDAFVLLPAYGACAVADGMGGLSRGEVASKTVVDTLAEAVSEGQSVVDGLRLAHRRIRASVLEAPSTEAMGSTAVAVSIAGNRATFAWVGDSRGYVYRSGKLRQVTRDHSFVQELVDRGMITPEEAAIHPGKAVVTRAIGVRELADIPVDELSVELQAGDRLLLCSDGLSGYLGDEAIAEVLKLGGDDRDVVSRLIKRTLLMTQAGDNLTAVIVTAKG